MNSLYIPEGCTLCPECEGAKELVYSCCTGEPVYNESMMCPVCHEHLGEEPCFTCYGLGYINEFKQQYINKTGDSVS